MLSHLLAAARGQGSVTFVRFGSRRRLLSTGLLAAATALCALAWAPTSALAAKSDCSDFGYGTFCMWQNAQYTGTLFVVFYGSVPSNQYNYVGATFNDEASSLYNYRNTYRTWVAYNANGSGPQACIDKLGSESDLAYALWPNGDVANDTISSYNLTSNSSTCPTADTFISLYDGPDSAAKTDTAPGIASTTAGSAAPTATINGATRGG
jgi:Peptidase inhibitor family I36